MESFFREAAQILALHGGDEPPLAREQALAPSLCDPVPLVDRAVQRLSAGEMAGDGIAPALPARAESDRLTGTVVHRLLQRVGLDHGLSVDGLRGLVPGLLRPGKETAPLTWRNGR